MDTHRVKWQVSLNNGETFQENKYPFQEIEGQLSPWNKLQEYLKTHKLEITSINLFTADGRTFNLPSIGKNPQFAAFRHAPKPDQISFFRAIAREAGNIEDLNSDKVKTIDWCTVIEATYNYYDCKLQLWVDEENPDNCWALCEFGH